MAELLTAPAAPPGFFAAFRLPFPGFGSAGRCCPSGWRLIQNAVGGLGDLLSDSQKQAAELQSDSLGQLARQMMGQQENLQKQLPIRMAPPAAPRMVLWERQTNL